jgi:hypothetical protein
MDTEVDRAVALLFPESGSHALDVKFFFQPGVTADVLARQVTVSFAAMGDDTGLIGSVDHA